MTALVTGAPGNVGTEVVKGLLAAGAGFRVGAWNVEAAHRTFGNEIDAVHFDFTKPPTFAAAFRGVERVFLVRPPTLANVQRDIAPAIYAAIGAGVKQIVFLSLQGVEHNRLTPHYKIEKLLLASGVPYTFLRSSFFMQNLSTVHRAEIRDRREIAVPVGKARTSFIDTRDIAAVAVRALTESGHENQIYTLTGSQALTYDEVARVMSAELGQPVRYTNPSAIAFFRRQVAEGRKAGFALIMTGLYTITRLGNAKTVTPDVQRVLGRPPIRFEEFVRDYRECWLKA